MAGLLPAAVYGLEVPPGDVLVPAAADFPSAFRITMAALDPTAAPEHPASLPHDAPPRATLKLVRVPIDSDDSDEDDSDEDDELDALINGDDDSEDDEANGGPSDPSKSKAAKKQALKEALALAAEEEEDEDEEMGGVNGKLNKGKAPATGEEDDEDDGEELSMDEYVVCTLNPNSHYQQTLDITVGENETVFFKVTGTHTIWLTGNYVLPVDDSPRGPGSDDEEDMYGYDEEDEDDELDYDEDDESDELDDIDDPRITEVDEEEDEAPKLIAAATKGNKKRAAEEESLDDLIAKADATNGLSKKQLKKLKNNSGDAAAAPVSKEDKKKVQFAEKLEQGPTGSAADKKGKKEAKKEEKKTEAKPAATGVRTVNGVTIDDRKIGKGPAAKKGSSVGMRYIGKLENGKVFDSNKKGKPFSFKLGTGQVIKGWDIGVEGMAVGGERRLTIPAKHAYGNQNVPGIPKNSTLIFDVKLVTVD